MNTKIKIGTDHRQKFGINIELGSKSIIPVANISCQCAYLFHKAIFLCENTRACYNCCANWLFCGLWTLHIFFYILLIICTIAMYTNYLLNIFTMKMIFKCKFNTHRSSGMSFSYVVPIKVTDSIYIIMLSQYSFLFLLRSLSTWFLYILAVIKHHHTLSLNHWCTL